MRDSLSADRYEQRPSSLSSRVVLSLGLGCCLGWLFVELSPTLFPMPRQGVAGLVDAWRGWYALASVALLAILARHSYARGPLRRHVLLVACFSILTSAGTACLYLCGWVLDPAVPTGVVVGRMLVAAHVGLVALWGEPLGRVGLRSVLSCVAASYGVSFALCLLVACLSPLAAYCVRALLPLFSGILLLVWKADACASDALPDAFVQGLPALGPQPRRLPFAVFVGTGLFGAIITYANHLSEAKTSVSTEVYTLIAGILVSLVVFGVAMLVNASRREVDFSLLYRFVNPLVISSLLLTLSLEGGFQHYEAFAIGLAWSFFRISTWMLWGSLSAKDPARSVCIFATGQAALIVFNEAAEAISRVVNPADVPLVGAASVLILLVVVNSTLVMSEGTLLRLFARPSEASAARAVPARDLAAVAVEDLAAATAGYGLSEREVQIALLVLQGKGTGSIAGEACITQSTLRTHLRNIYGKTGVHSRQELVSLLRELL